MTSSRLITYFLFFSFLIAALLFMAPPASAIPVEFVYDDGMARSVALAGSFNDWSRTAHPLVRDGERWSVTVTLDPGTYEYKFVIDDSTWRIDPRNPLSAPTSHNSLLRFRHAGDLPWNFRRSTGRMEFTLADRGFSNVAVTGEFAGWATDLHPLRKEGSTWRGVFHLPAIASCRHFVADGRWISVEPGEDPRGFFIEPIASDRWRIEADSRPVETTTGRVVVRARLVPPANSPSARADGFTVRAWLDGEPTPAILDEESGFITARVDGLAIGPHALRIDARRGVERAVSAVAGILRAPPRTAPVAYIRVGGPAWTGVAYELDGATSRAAAGRTLRYRWILIEGGGALENAALAKARYTPRANGRHRLRLDVTDDRGESDAMEIVIASRPPPAGLSSVPFSVRERDLARHRPIRSVHLAGSFNNWSMTAAPMTRHDDGKWRATSLIPAGDHEYKFVVNGTEWENDPANPIRVGPHQNSLLKIAGEPEPAATAFPGFAPLNPLAPDAILYQIMVPRFRDSDGDGIGDLRGVAEKLPWLAEMGVNWICLLPIFEGPSQHGYHTTDYMTIDREIGTPDDFQHLIAEARRHGIRIMLDYVFNHSSTDHPVFLAAHADPASPWRTWHLWTGPDRWIGFLKADRGSMPDWNFDDLRVRRYALEVGLAWLDRGIDGWRTDVAHDVPDDFWIEWCNLLRARNPEVLLFPEFDEPGYDLYYDFAPLDIFKVAAGQMVPAVLDRSLTAVPHENRFPVRFLSYHDRDRLLSIAGGNQSLSLAAMTFLMTIPGLPMIYYGEEHGMTGTMGTNTNREPVDWAGGDHDLIGRHRELIRLRRRHAALRGNVSARVETGDDRVYAYTRGGAGERLLVVLNLSDAPCRARFAGRLSPLFESGVRQSPGSATIELETFGAGVYRFE
jgi:glycosidase